MKIAIHNRKGGFTDRWIEYCKEKNIDYQIVNAYDSDIIEQLKGFDIFMWNHSLNNYKDLIAARRVLNALEYTNIKLFPDFNTGWAFDDKLAEKYILESIGEPIIKTHVFYDKKTAKQWAEETTFPKVWKLKGGAGGANVKLVNSKKQTKKLIKKSFGRGFSQFDRWGHLKERISTYQVGIESFTGVIKGLVRIVYIPELAKMKEREKGYVMFQDFIPNNTRDNRIIVIYGKAFGVSRLMRKGDFKSKDVDGALLETKYIDDRCVTIAFDIARKTKNQCLGIDFIFDTNNNPVICEMGYGFEPITYKDCPGYWDEELNWHEGKFIPQDWIIEGLINDVSNK